MARPSRHLHPVRWTRRLTGLVAGLVVLAGLMPSAALAAPDEDSCAALRAVPFSLPLPDAMRTVGTHRFEWRTAFTEPDGSTVEGTVQNAITISATAPAYPNTVLLRLVRNTTLLADGSVIAVDTIQPDQPAQLYAAAFALPEESLFLSSFRLWLRYETSKNRWTPFVELEPGPETSFCNQVTTSAWKKTYGWD